MISLCDDKQAGIIGTFNTTSRYLDDILNINKVYLFCQYGKSNISFRANATDTEAVVLDLHFYLYCFNQNL